MLMNSTSGVYVLQKCRGARGAGVRTASAHAEDVASRRDIEYAVTKGNGPTFSRQLLP